MKRKSETATEPTFEVGNEVIIDSGKIIWKVEHLEGNVATVIASWFVGAKTISGDPVPAATRRRVDVYRLTKVGA